MPVCASAASRGRLSAWSARQRFNGRGHRRPAGAPRPDTRVTSDRPENGQVPRCSSSAANDFIAL
jgi:hypothetical protein